MERLLLSLTGAFTNGLAAIFRALKHYRLWMYHRSFEGVCRYNIKNRQCQLEVSSIFDERIYTEGILAMLRTVNLFIHSQNSKNIVLSLGILAMSTFILSLKPEIGFQQQLQDVILLQICINYLGVSFIACFFFSFYQNNVSCLQKKCRDCIYCNRIAYYC